MKNFFIVLSFLILPIALIFAGDETWQDYWHKGFDLRNEGCYREAGLSFDSAIKLMSEEDQNAFPFVLVDRAENNFSLKNYSEVMLDTEKALKSEELTDYERLCCASKRMAVYNFMGDEDAAMEEYRKYFIGCPLFPKLDYFKEKIIIRNIPNCDCYKGPTRELMLSKHCKDRKDIVEYGSIWIINITKDDDCGCYRDEIIEDTDFDVLLGPIKKTPEQIQACCNNCDKLASAATAICGCYEPSKDLNNYAFAACKAACWTFIETTRQECRECCLNSNNKCWDSFESWKAEYEKKYPECGRPPAKCP